MTSSVRSWLWVTFACAVAAISYAGAVRQLALMVFILPSLLVVAVVTWRTRARQSMPASALIGAFAALALAELVNVVSGTDYGPAARSTFLAGSFTAVAVALASSPYPALFLLPLTGVTVGALALGAGGEVRLVAVASVVVAVTALAEIESDRRQWRGQRPLAGSAIVLPVAIAAIAAVIAVWQTQHDPRRPAVVARGLVQVGIKPSWSDPLPARHHTSTSRLGVPHDVSTPPGATPARATHTTHATRYSSSRSGLIAGTIAALLVLVIAAIALRLLYVRMAWRRLRARLSSDDPADAVIGAWQWAVSWLAAARMPLAPHLAPDIAAAGGLPDMPAPVAEPLILLARVTTPAAFARRDASTPNDAVAAWRLADATCAAAQSSLTRRGRARNLLVNVRITHIAQNAGVMRDRPIGLRQ